MEDMVEDIKETTEKPKAKASTRAAKKDLGVALWVSKRYSDHTLVLSEGKKTFSVTFNAHKLELDLNDPEDRKTSELIADAVKRKGTSDVVRVTDKDDNTTAEKARMSRDLSTLELRALRAFLSNKERSEAGIAINDDAEKVSLVSTITNLKTY